MKKIFLVLVMFITCSLFAEVTQSVSYYETLENPILPVAEFKVSYKLVKNLQTGKTTYSISVDANGKNYTDSFIYDKSADSITEFEEMYNELKYVIEYVLPANEWKRYGVKLEKSDLSFYGEITDYTNYTTTYSFGTKYCKIPYDKIQSFADIIKTVIDKFYEYQKEFESNCFPVKPFSK